MVWVKSLRLKLSRKKNHIRGGRTDFSCWRENVREREREGKSSNFSLRSTEISWSEFVGIKMKVHLLDKGYTWVPKTQDFSEDLSKEFRKSNVSGLGSVHGTS